MYYRCFVGGLDEDTEDETLREMFAKYGEVTHYKIMRDSNTGKSRGIGFINFSSEQSMRDAIEGLDGTDFLGRTLTVKEADQSQGIGGETGGAYGKGTGRSYGGGAYGVGDGQSDGGRPRGGAGEQVEGWGI